MDDREMEAANEKEQSQPVNIEVNANNANAAPKEAVIRQGTAAEELERQLQEKEDQIHEYIGRLQRLQADFENYRKRLAREQEGISKLIENRVFMKVLPIFDSFDRAIRAYEHNHDKDALADGIKYIYAQFSDLFKTEGIEPLEVVGKPFDPLRHEGLIIVESDGPPNIILEEFERGFQRSGQVLRPSRVKISKKRVMPVPDPMKQESIETEPERGDP